MACLPLCHLASYRAQHVRLVQRPGSRPWTQTAHTLGKRCRRRQAQITKAVAEPLSDLQQKYGISGHVEIAEGKGGLPKVTLTHASGSRAEVYLYGGTVLSWTQPSGDEVLYTRPDAKFDRSKPISGGMPHCFPQFGPGKIQQHGFARNCDWSIASTSADPQPDDREPEVELVLTDNDYTKGIWPHEFKTVFSVSLHGEALRTDLRVINTGDQAFDFTTALHSYFEVAHVSKAKVRGLKGLTYLDKTTDPNNPEEKQWDEELVSINGPWDAVFKKPGDYVELDVGTGAAVAISTSGWEDVTVWNPWEAMKDSYEHFVCVENGQISSPVTLQPGSSWRATQELTVVNLQTPEAITAEQ